MIRIFCRLLGFTLPLSLLHAWPTYADQCQLLNQRQAETALHHILQAREIGMYCRPCGDERPIFHRVETGRIEATEGGFEVRIEGPQGPITPIDLAYLFVALNPKKGVYTNLAHLAQCPAVETPLSIDREGPLAP